MDRVQFKELFNRRPFQPFRVHLTDGRALDIERPDMHILGESYIDIGFPEPNVLDPYVDHSIIVLYTMIARVELLPAPVGSTASFEG